MSINKFKKYINMPLMELVALGDKIRKTRMGGAIDVCGIVNAKSGVCSEDCKFCAQSIHHNTSVEQYLLKDIDYIVSEAYIAERNGAKRFGIVTSGNKMSGKEINTIAEAIGIISRETDLEVCASLGALDSDKFDLLKNNGLLRYHHNIETSREYYRKIVSTHDFSERINTIQAAKKNGLEVCSGGIIGLGESWEDRISMALTLRDLEVDSVPLNFLVPIPGTPLAKVSQINPRDAIRTIALFRIILKDKIIKIAAGRESVLKDFQGLMFMAGANGIMIGGYLTVKGRSVEEDTRLLNRVQGLWKN